MNQSALRCIFCLSDLRGVTHPPEHVFPDAIGGALRIYSVCGACNSFLGAQVDSVLVDDWFVQSKRYILGISSRTGPTPNPFDGSRLSDGRRIRVRGNPRNTSLYIHPTLTERRTDDGIEIEVTVDGTDVSEIDGMIQRWTERATRRFGRLPEGISNVAIREHVVNHPTVNMNVRLDLCQIERACAKIAYELAHEWIGSPVMFDDLGTAIRIWVMTGQKAPEIQSWLGIGDHDVLYPINKRLNRPGIAGGSIS